MAEELRPGFFSAAFAASLLCISLTNVAKQVEFLYWKY
jgi:hypothetical protein